MKKILMIEDCLDFGQLLKEFLQDDYQVTLVSTVKDAKSEIANQNFDLYLTDLNLPDGSGLELCTYLRQSSERINIPIFIISGNSDSSAKISGFDLGANIYIEKPFDFQVLLAQIRAKFKEIDQNRSSMKTIQKGLFKIDDSRQRIFILNEKTFTDLQLSPIEYRILLNFISCPERLFSRDQLISVCSGAGHFTTDRTMDKHICSIRQKLKSKKCLIKTVYGEGYIFEQSNEKVNKPPQAS